MEGVCIIADLLKKRMFAPPPPFGGRTGIAYTHRFGRRHGTSGLRFHRKGPNRENLGP